ncbi:hypothetical protein SY88_14920 [Clostridiales bacterium PH28_bin88]|nr:hypothetical protein SY88_14920 [Clostridiales bacterium PH28_bin88]
MFLGWVQHISRDDIAALTREAAEASGITYVMDIEGRRLTRSLVEQQWQDQARKNQASCILDGIALRLFRPCVKITLIFLKVNTGRVRRSTCVEGNGAFRISDNGVLRYGCGTHL